MKSDHHVARFTIPRKRETLCNLSCCKADSNFLVKRATSLFNSFCSDVGKQVARFLVARFCGSLNKWCSEFKCSYLIFSREMRSIFFLQLRGLFRQGLQCKGKEFECELSRINLGLPILGKETATSCGTNYCGPVTVPLADSLRARRLKGKGKGVSGARETRRSLPFPFKRLPRRLSCRKRWISTPGSTSPTLYEQRVGSLMSFRIYTCRSYETGTMVYRPYPRRLESLTVCRWLFKGSTFSPVI